MLDIGWSELLLVAVVAIIVVGPKDLPKLMRSFGFYAGKVKRAAADFQRQFNEAMVESEADEVRKNIEAIRGSMGDMPLMLPQGGPLQNVPGEPLAALEAQSHASAKRKASPRTKALRAKGARAKAASGKTPRAKTRRAKTPSVKTLSVKTRKAKVVAKPPSKTVAKRPAKTPSAKTRAKTLRAKTRRARAPAKAPVKARRTP